VKQVLSLSETLSKGTPVVGGRAGDIPQQLGEDSKPVLDGVRECREQRVEDLEGERLQHRVDRGDLGEDADAAAVLLDPARLPGDAMQAHDERFRVLGVAVNVTCGLGHVVTACRVLRKRRRRRLFVTTNRLETAIAAAAMIGFSRPATARGMAATL